MAVLDILKFPDPMLKGKARPITRIDDDIRQLARDMAQTMYSAPGVGLAAPQVGRPVRLIVVDVMSGQNGGDLRTLINPEIVRSEGETVFEEGCLSVPDVREEITRAGSVTVKALDLDGNEVSIEAEDLFAIVLQHEIDHLNGILFIDRLSKLKQGLIKKKLKKAQANADAL